MELQSRGRQLRESTPIFGMSHASQQDVRPILFERQQPWENDQNRRVLSSYAAVQIQLDLFVLIYPLYSHGARSSSE